MKIFITGATGFIGKQLLSQILETEHDLVCLVRKKSHPGAIFQNNRITIIEGDITDRSSVKKAMTGCDSVINLAGLYKFWEPDKEQYGKVNIEGTRNVMECAVENKVKKVVHVSTVVTSGKPSEDPFTEKSMTGPEIYSQYAKTKSEGDKIVWELHRDRGLPVVMIYPCAVCGANDTKATGKYIADILHRRLPATVFTQSSLTFVHVKDVARAIILALEKTGIIGEKYLVGKHLVTFGEVNDMVSEISGIHPPKMNMPGFMAMMGAYVLTGISNLVKKSPPFGMSVDQMKTMKYGFRADGSKVERELGLTYTPFRTSLEEKIAEEMKSV